MKLLACVLCLLLCADALAQTQTRRAQVYRCGPEGRDLRDSPCPTGQAAGTEVAYDQPSQADSRAARERHMAEAKQAAALSSARRASEAEARRLRSQAVGLQALPPSAQPASGPATVTLQPPKTARPHRPAASAGSGR